MKNAVVVALAGVAIFTGSNALAWGHKGHELVGSIADAILAHHPNAAHHVHALIDFDLAQGAKWADCVKDVYRAADGSFAISVSPQNRKACTTFDDDEHETDDMKAYISRNWDNCVYAPHKACAGAFHFTDIPVQDDGYSDDLPGANTHDVVHVLTAAIEKLRDDTYTTPEPIHIETQKEALLLIAHLTGDIHQPLHVGAVYLTAAGRRVDPAESEGALPTTGGNDITLTGGPLHHIWDSIPTTWNVGSTSRSRPKFVSLAEHIRVTHGDVATWPKVWATESVLLSHHAFDRLTFHGSGNGDADHPTWSTTLPTNYNSRVLRPTEQAQIIKAGARLAQILVAIWPDH